MLVKKLFCPKRRSLLKTNTIEAQNLIDTPSSSTEAVIPRDAKVRSVHPLESLSDKAIRTVIDKHVGRTHASSSCLNTRRITSDLVLRTVPQQESYEAFIMKYVAENTTIPIPRIHRILVDPDKTHIFMEYIEGTDLASAWPKMNIWRKFRVAWTIRRYVKQLRGLKLPEPDVPGPFDDSGRPLRCKGHFFTNDGAGPFASRRDMWAWFERKQRVATYFQARHDLKCSRASFVDSEPFVLVHGDISLRNIRIGTDGTVWLLNWTSAGIYPKSFEYCSIMAGGQTLDTPRSWLRLASLMAPAQPAKNQWQFLCSIKLALVFRYDESDFLW
ncbi:hypothetical protein AX17_006725 [Amanita inopinata Kibby_2008]|nr:hypothetical protein AX17_006725 [Amanita inopinata Kibby_2008]